MEKAGPPARIRWRGVGGWLYNTFFNGQGCFFAVFDDFGLRRIPEWRTEIPIAWGSYGIW